MTALYSVDRDYLGSRPTLLEGPDTGLEWKSKNLFLPYLIKDDISSICKQSKASVVKTGLIK